MTQSTALRRGRVPAAVLALAILASLVPLASVYAAVTVTPATGGSAISVDDFGTTTFTTLSGPSITEGAAGALAAGTTTILTIPSGFVFNPAVGNISVSGAGCTLTASVVMTSTTATVTINTASTVATCVLTFVGLQVQPTNGSAGSAGNITKTGTSAAPGGPTNYGTLTKVAGKVASLLFIPQPSANTNGGVPFAAQPGVLALDQFNNGVPTVPVVLSITPGVGPAGAMLTCSSLTVTTNPGGGAPFAGCKIDKAGTYTLRASSGGKFADSGTLVINVGPANGLKFTSYPAVTTPPLLAPQPVVAIVDLGGNIITSSTLTVTLAINQNGGTFACSSGLSVAAVAGVATFAGCTESVVASGYTLTATSTTPVPSTTGAAFEVSPPVLVFTTQPGTSTAGALFPTNPQVAIQNGGVTLTAGISATVTLSIGTNPSGGTLTCTGGTSVGTISGVATFTGCAITNAGTGYTLVATATNVVPLTSIGPGTSNPFNVVGVIPPASITIGASSPVITWGGPVTLSVNFATNGAARSFALQAARDGVTWSTIATLTTDGSGSASFIYRPANNNYYRVNFAGAADLGAAISATTRVVVRQIAVLRPTNSGLVKSISRGRTITFTTTIRPSRPDLPLAHANYEVYKRVGGAWSRVLLQTVAVNSAGQAMLAVTFSTAGSYYLRSIANPTTFNANSSWSAVERYDVH